MWGGPAPAPAPGARVRFVPELLVAARERLHIGPVPTGRPDDDGLVIHEDPRDLTVWPCRLWRVTDPQDVVRPTTRWFRCQAFTVLAELPAWRVFGEHGDRVAAVIEQADGLTAEQVARLSIPDRGAADEIYRTGWERWRVRTTGAHPTGSGLSTISHAADHAARRSDESLFVWDEDDGIEYLHDPRWTAARSAALQAAMAWGAPELFTPPERQILTHAWTAITGNPPRKT